MSQPLILLVEDDAQHARSIIGAIESRVLGSTTIHVKNGEEAVLWVGANDCALVLLDYDLPGINGLEALARIRQRKPNLPVIMLSGAASEQVAVDAFRARVADFVPKRLMVAWNGSGRCWTTRRSALSSPHSAPGSSWKPIRRKSRRVWR